MTQARKIETFRDKYFTTIVYEYRGCRYEVEYANGHQICCSPAWVQHRDEQEKIDKMLSNPKTETKAEQIDLDEIWEMLGW
jgi:hypothetical protein